MKNTLLRFTLVFALFQSFTAHAQNAIKFDWLASASKYYIGGAMFVKDMASGADGSTVAVGYFTETVDADPGPDTFNLKAKSGEDIFIIKYSKLGKLLYAYSFGASGIVSDEVAKSIAIDNLDNVYITGTFNSTIDFDPGKGTATLSALTSTEIFVLSLDKNGIFRYAINIGDTKDIGKIESGESIVTDKQHNIYVAGTIDGANVDFDPGAGEALETSRNTNIFFAKYDERGNYVFSKVIKGERSDEVSKIRLDKKGNIVLCGDFYSYSLDFDPGTGAAVLSTNGKNDIFFAKYDSVGNYLFAKSIGGIRFDAATSLAIGTDNSIIVTGTFQGKSVDFDAGAGTKLISGTPNHDDNFVTKYDEDGNYIFAFSIVGTYSQNYNDIGVDADNNIFITGEFDGNYVDLDPGPDTYTISTSKSGDYYIAKYTANGDLIFANAIGNTNQSKNDYFYLSKLLINKNGSTSISGLYKDTLDVDTGPGTANLYAPSGTLYIANYTNDGAYVSSLSADNYNNYYNLNTTPTASTVDSAGNTYVAGYFNGRYDFDPGPGVYELESLDDYRYSSYFAKYSSTGKLIFAKALIGSEPIINAMVVDKDENIYLTGIGGASTDFDPSNGVKYLNNSNVPSNVYGYFFAKYNKDGALIFANGEDASYGYGPNSIAIDSSKNIYIAGDFYNKTDFDPGPGSHILKTIGIQDIFFAKYDSSGKFVYAYNIGSPTHYNSAVRIALNSKGDIIICGAFSGNAVDFDPGPNKFTLSDGASGGASYIASYKNDGSLIGAFAIKAANGYYEVELSSLIIDNENNIYIAGKYNGSVDFDPSFKTYILKPRSSLFFASYNESGLFRFVKGITSTSNYVSYNSALNGLAGDGNKNIYVAGQFGTDNIDCDPGPDSALLFNEHVDRTNDDNLNIFLAKYDSLGNYKYSYGFSGDSAIGFNSSIAINVDRNENISYAGFAKTKIDFDPGADSAFFIPTIPNYQNLFLARYSQSPDCNAPDGLFTSSVQSTSATLNWQYSTSVKGFEIQYKSAQQQTWNIAYAAGTTRKITVNNLLPATKYGWKIRASCNNVFSDFSDTVLFTTKAVANIYLTGNAELKAAANASHFTISPNPVSNNLFVKIQNIPEASGQAIASIVTAQGVVAVTVNIAVVNHAVNAAIQLPPTLAPGNYFIKIKTSTAEYKGVFIKQ